jgi:hypothetical protein
MRHAQADYITAGYMHEKASSKRKMHEKAFSKRKAHVVAGIISRMLEQETESDYFDALYFIERGRKEARQEVKA